MSEFLKKKLLMEYMENQASASKDHIRVVSGSEMIPIRVLLIQLEFPLWKAAKSWGYAGHFGLEEGLHANNVETFILPAWGLIEPDSHLSWLVYAKELCHNEHFDQVWLWLVHCEYPKWFLEWVETLAPVRVGCLYESLSYTREECFQNPKLETRSEEVVRQMQGLTHIICSDECDASYIQEQGIANAIWSPTFIPSRFVSHEYVSPANSMAAFFGSPYSEERRRWLQETKLSSLLERPSSPEDATAYPLQFDRLHQTTLDHFKKRLPITKVVLQAYVDELRSIRKGAFATWMNGLSQWNGIVNLPSFGKVYTSRIAEAMAAGSPAISWDVPSRPRNRGLFEEGKEILLYNRNQPEQLVQHLLDLQRRPDLARTLVGHAREKIKRYHTAEIRVQQILQWIESGIEPDFESRSKDKGFSLDVPNIVGSQDLTFTCQTFSEDLGNIKSQETDQTANVLEIQDENTSMGFTGSQEEWGKMSRNQVNQRNQEDQFYTDLFVRSGTWSTPTPNTDERMRWEKIKGFLPEILRKLSQGGHQSVRILDVGCGRGWLTNLLSDYGYCEGIEPVEPVVEYGRKLFPHLTLYSGFPEDLLTRKNFQPYDLIVTSEVIEHIPHAQKSRFVHTLQQLLKPNGAVILTTPRAEVWDQWKTVSTPNQPIEDWITEQDLLAIFEQLAFKELCRAHIYFDLPSFQYVESPQAETIHAVNNIIPLYQIWAFGFGPIFEERFNQLQSLHNGVGSQGSTLEANGRMSLNTMPSPSIEAEKEQVSSKDENPLVSVIVPTFNRPSTLKVALESIVQQSLVDYEIIVINDAGADVEDIVTSFNVRNNVTYIRHGKNRGLAAARNSGLGVARGKYIAYLDDDDRFLPNHLETLVGYLEESSCQVAYSDAWRVWEVQENEQYVEKKRDVPYSNDFNPEQLLIGNFFPVLCMIHEKACLNKAGVFDENLTTHEDWDLWIRLSRHFNFSHISKTTAEFTWRMDGSSMTSGIPNDYLRTKKIIYQKYEENFRLQPSLIPLRDRELQNLESRMNPQSFECSIIIPVFNKVELTEQCLMHLAEVTTGISYEVVIVDNHSTDGTREFLESLGGDIQVIYNSTNLGFAKGCNQGAAAAKGKHLVFLNNDTIPKAGWLDPLIEEVNSHDDVAVVGSKLLYPDHTIQHAGVVISKIALTPYHLFQGVPGNMPVVNARKEFQAVTAACMLVRRETFEKVGGFDEGFVNGFEDVDMCLKIRQLGKKVVYQPRSCLYHLESQTQGRKDHDEGNAKLFLGRWEHQWLIDEDLVAYQCGYFIQHYVLEGKLRSQLIPLGKISHPVAWERVLALQALLFGQVIQPLSEWTDSRKIQNLLLDVEGWPNDIGVLAWVGRVCESLRCEQEAIQFWGKLLTIGDHPNARLGLARAMLKKGNLGEAQRHLDELERVFTPKEEGWTLQGILSMQKQEFAEAKYAFEESLSIDCESKKARMGLGMACMGLGLNDEAWGTFEHVVSVDPDGIEAMRCLIQAGTALQRWEALASHLTRFVERNPAVSDMRFALAGVEYRCGRLEKAMEQLTWLRLMTPDFEGLEDLGRLLQTVESQESLASIQ